MKHMIHSHHAPKAIGTYSQAIRAGDTLYISGQIGLDPTTMQFVSDDFEEQLDQVFKNVGAICQEAGATFKDIVKVTIYLTDMSHFPKVNDVMSHYFREPYPARAVVGVSQLPKNALVEADAVIHFL